MTELVVDKEVSVHVPSPLAVTMLVWNVCTYAVQVVFAHILSYTGMWTERHDAVGCVVVCRPWPCSCVHRQCWEKQDTSLRMCTASLVNKDNCTVLRATTSK